MNKLAIALPLMVVLAACDNASTEPTSLVARAVIAPGSGSSTVTVTEASVVRQAEDSPPTNNWVLYTRAGTPATSAGFVAGPGAPSLGIGSLHFQLGPSTEKAQLFNYDHVGVALSSVTQLSYATYKSATSSFPFPSINVQVDINGGTLNVGEFRTFVYEPYVQPGFVDATGVWETRDAYNGGAGKWWSTGASPCGQANPCNWSTLVAAFPGATALAVGVNVGSGNAGLDGSVDAFTIGYGGGSVTYDFEPYAVATSKDACKNGGWATLKRADGSSFKNQGDCVSYTNNGK